MAAQGGIGFTVLPQFQANAYDIQRKQALSQALLGNALQNQAANIPTNMPVTPKFSIGAGLAQLGQALLASKLGNEASQDLQNLGAQQWASLTGQGTPQQDNFSVAQQAMNDGASAGSIGPTVQNADLYASRLTQQPQPTQQVAPLAPGGALNPQGLPTPLAAQAYLTNPSEYFKEFVAPNYKPTEASMLARQGGIDPLAANAALLKQKTYIAPLAGGAGQTYRDPLNPAKVLATNPNIGEGMQPVYDAQGQFVGTLPIAGYTGAKSAIAQAEAAGRGNVEPIQVFNPASGQYEYTNKTAVAQPANAGFPQGTQVPQSTNIGAIVPGQSDQLSILQQERAGILAQPDSAQKTANLAAIDREIARATPSQTRFVASPSLGAQTKAEATERGQVETMQNSFKGLQNVRSGGNMALEDIGRMTELASGKNPLVAGERAADYAALFSSDAAEYQKSRDNLVNNLGSQLGIGTDSARNLVYGSIPAYGAPKPAIENGLKTLQGQVQMRMLKADLLTNAYTNGDARTYNNLENSFDQQITPKIANIISLPAGPQRAQALKEAASNPQIRSKLEWAVNNGVLK